MPLSLDQIATELVNDNRPSGPDGCSNVDRLAFLCEVFETDELDLDADYDFTPIVGVKDPMQVAAARHLCLLKLDLLNRNYDNYHVSREEYNAYSAMLIVALQRINWHLHYVEQGLPTPPWPALH